MVADLHEKYERRRQKKLEKKKLKKQQKQQENMPSTSGNAQVDLLLF
jgi:hypothetical protein